MGVMARVVGCWVVGISAAHAGWTPETPPESVVAVDPDRLQWEQEQLLYKEAAALGVTRAVAASGMTQRSQRSLAIAIVREAKKNDLDPLLVVALIRAESSFNNYAVSGVGAMGLMQLMPPTGEYLLSKRGLKLGRKTNLFDHELNVELGAAYLADLIRRFGTLEHALVAYNAGPGAARKILAKPEVRRRFLAGYPLKVASEHKRLRAGLKKAELAENAAAVDPKRGS
jgi:soluble lytic murein transglycosylase